VVALASAVRPLRKPGADTVRQMPGFCVKKPAMAAALPAFCSWRNENHAQACGLCHAGEVGDRDTRQTEDRVDAVSLRGIDDQMKAVGHFLYVARLRDLRFQRFPYRLLREIPHLRGDAGPARRQKNQL